MPMVMVSDGEAARWAGSRWSLPCIYSIVAVYFEADSVIENPNS